MGAKMVEFGGWEMPVQYTGIIQEHVNVREKCGLFDVSHMGEIYFTGSDALKAVQRLITNNAARLKENQILYTPMCYPDGGIVDDLLVYRLKEEEFMLVVNASNIDKDFAWMKENSSGQVEIIDRSQEYAQLAIQGPESKRVLQGLTPVNLEDISYYWFTPGEVAGVRTIISRTGYTGEAGYELYLSTEDSVKVWEQLMEAGHKYGILPIGLGARDTLRLEKKLCLYGNDIDKNRHPLEAGLGWTVKFDKGDFIAREPLLKYQKEGYRDRLIGFKLIERGVARHGYKITVEGEPIGIVTSGSFSPTLKENIGLGYVVKEKAKPGQEIEILIRNKPVLAEIVETPFV
jgi:aminomethyltransferase